MNEQKVADALASVVIGEIQSGMVVGLGTGRTASRGVLALADRVRDENLSIQCVPTSHATETLARSQQLPLLDFSMVERVDFLFDGADEVDPRMRMLKGAGGAMLRERIVAQAADRRVYMVGEKKLVPHLGATATLPVAVLAFGFSAIRRNLRELGLNGVVRRTLDGHLFVTDNGNLIIDVTLGEHNDLDEVAAILDSVPGVVDHGLFVDEADEIYIERNDGIIEKLVRIEEGGESGGCGPSCGCR